MLTEGNSQRRQRLTIELDNLLSRQDYANAVDEVMVLSFLLEVKLTELAVDKRHQWFVTVIENLIDSSQRSTADNEN